LSSNEQQANLHRPSSRHTRFTHLNITASANEDNDRFGLDLEDGRAQMQSEIPLQGVPQYGIHMNPSANTNASFEVFRDSDSRSNYSREGKEWKWVYCKKNEGKGASA